MSFELLNLDNAILRAIEETGYTTPTAIQAQAIPVVMDGHDLMASAQCKTFEAAIAETSEALEGQIEKRKTKQLNVM